LLAKHSGHFESKTQLLSSSAFFKKPIFFLHQAIQPAVCAKSVEQTSPSALPLVGKLVSKHQAWHHKLINSCRRNPRVYYPGNIVFACRAVRSTASKGRIGKLKFSFNDSWQVVASAHGGSYKIKHCHHPTRRMKKRAADLTPYPAEIICFEPINGLDTQYSHLHKAMGPHPFEAAGISGFLPPQPFKVPAKFIDIGNYKDFWWPTLL
jgi:hypothetical protein